MKPELGPLERPIAILVDYIASENTTIHVKQHDGQISGSNFTVSDHDPQTTSATSPSKLFTVEGKLLALDLRRTFRDPKGTPMFDLYRKPFGYTWWIDLPTEGCRLQSAVVRLAPRWNNFKDKIYIEVLNAAADGQEVRLEALGQDVHKLRTNVILDDKVVMTAKRSDKMSAYLFGMWKRPEWIVDVAQGMDISLAAAIMVVLAATMYDTSIPASLAHPKEHGISIAGVRRSSTTNVLGNARNCQQS